MNERVARLREQAGMTRRQLADAVGVSPAAVTNWEKGSNPPTTENQQRICEALGITMAEFWSESPEAAAG